MIIPLDILTANPFDPRVLIYLVIVVVLLLLSAMISGSETALFSLSPAAVDKVKKSGRRADRAIVRLLSSQDYLLATLLVMNNLVNVGVVILSNVVIDIFFTFGDSLAWEFVIKTVIVAFVLLMLGEITPKVYAAYNPLGFARFTAPLVVALRRLVKPFSWLLVRSGSRLNESVSRRRGNISMDVLSNAMEMTRDQSDEERQMLSGIVTFVNTEAGDIMVLRPDVVAIDVEEDFAAVKKVIKSSGFSRIPVYAETLDNIRGILYVKDMIPYIGRGDDFEWRRHLRGAYFVPQNKKINDLLEEFRTGKVHLAVVVDEYGSTQGLVSLEDILEEIVGDITDESDAEQRTFYEKIDDNTYIFEGKTRLFDLERVLDLGEDYLKEASGGSETVAGLMLELRRDFLKKGENVSTRGITFRVNSLDGRRIDKVKVTIKR